MSEYEKHPERGNETNVTQNRLTLVTKISIRYLKVEDQKGVMSEREFDIQDSKDCAWDEGCGCDTKNGHGAVERKIHGVAGRNVNGFFYCT